MKLSKMQEAEYRQTLHAARDEMFGIALGALLENELEKVKDAIIVPETKDVPTLQGEAQALKRILKFLKERQGPTKQV